MLCSVTVAKIFFGINFLFEQINRLRTAVRGHPQLPLKCRLPNLISFDVFDRCFCKFDARACERLGSCAKRLGALRSRGFARGLGFI